MSTVKDKVLKHVVTSKEYQDFHSFRIKHDLNLEHYQVINALLELQEGKFVTLIETSTTGSGHMRTYSIRTVDAPAYQFYNSGKKFRCKSFWKSIQDFLKNYWVIATAFIPLSFNIFQWQYTERKKTELKEVREQLNQARDSIRFLQNKPTSEKQKSPSVAPAKKSG